MGKVEYRKSQRHLFINPYTFVPTPRDGRISRTDVEGNDPGQLHTGVLRCRLVVRTPVGIPDAEKERETEVKDHKEYPFFSYEENGKRVPVIPGSSLRGAIRSVFEAATDSCFSTLRDDTGLSRRVGSREAYKPGILRWERGGWHLYETERYLLAADPNNSNDRSIDNHYTKYGQMSPDAYVQILRKKDGLRVAKTSRGEELRFGDIIEFDIERNSSYAKGRYLIWSGVAKNIKKKRPNSAGSPGEKCGVVYLGETFAKKKHGESVFVATREVKSLTQQQIEKAYKGLEETLEIYRNPAINRSQGHSGYGDFEHAKKESGIPVWFDVKDGKLSLASIGRTFFKNTLNDLVGDRKACTSRKKLCEACALFGMAKDESLGSRIRFTDAKAEPGYVLKKATLKILGQPRYSYTPFYARFKTGGSNKAGSGGRCPESYDDKDVEIAGRKFYWHDPRAEKESGLYSTRDRNNMNNTMELVMPGAEFCFDVYYDGISADQLEKLMWCLNFGENQKDGRWCHKLGHGKPLGLGSVKILIEKKEERVFRDGTYEWKREDMPGEDAEPEVKNKKGILKVMDFQGPNAGTGQKLPIMYPDIYDENGKPFEDFEKRKNNDLARHKWYSENKEEQKRGKRTEKLPDILERDQSLPIYMIQQQKKL